MEAISPLRRADERQCPDCGGAMLVRDGVALNQAHRTVCWQRLDLLHRSLPRHYRDPEQLYFHLKRDPTLMAQPPSCF